MYLRLEMVTEIDVNRWILEALKDVNVKVFPCDVISVSEASSPCLRKAYFDRVKAPMPSPADFIKIVGEDAHSRILEVLRKHGYDVESSFKLKIKDMTLVGRVDAFNDKHVIEFKVVDEIPEKPYKSHEQQVNLYMLATRRSEAYIVYISRRDGRVKVFRARYSRRVAKEAAKRAYRLFLALKNNSPPPPERSNYCNYCPYRLSCSTR
jgi:CRISPR/Cas system-associated exonuclease Cas4 (RecB family)